MTEQQKALMDALFKAFTLGYQAKFTSLFDRTGDVATAVSDWKELWAGQLTGLVVYQVRYGVEHVLKVFPEYAPTVGEFFKLCRSAPPPPMQRLEQASFPIDQPGYLDFQRRAIELGHLKPRA